MMQRDLKAEFEKLLEREGGLYTFGDVIERIKSGKFQAFREGDTLVVTEIHEYPRKRVLNINYAVGNAEDLDRIFPKLEAFQKEVGAEFIGATSRVGWLRKKFADRSRWKMRSINFMRV